MSLQVKYAAPDKSIASFVQGFWMLQNNSKKGIPATILPDGIIDLFLFRDHKGPLQLSLKGIDTEPSQVVIEPKTKMFSVGFKLLAVEYLLHTPVSSILNIAQDISNDFWNFKLSDLNNFDRFCEKATQKIKSVPTADIDPRKKELFELLYASNGSLNVKELSEKVYWSSRQINRYFNQQFGISLKSYSKILRFRASFQHIKQGKLFPEENFFDQAHFIKEVKKLSGVLPKDLNKNKDDRFLQFTALPLQ